MVLLHMKIERAMLAARCFMTAHTQTIDKAIYINIDKKRTKLHVINNSKSCYALAGAHRPGHTTIPSSLYIPVYIAVLYAH